MKNINDGTENKPITINTEPNYAEIPNIRITGLNSINPPIKSVNKEDIITNNNLNLDFLDSILTETTDLNSTPIKKENKVSIQIKDRLLKTISKRGEMTTIGFNVNIQLLSKEELSIIMDLFEDEQDNIRNILIDLIFEESIELFKSEIMDKIQLKYNDLF